MAKYKLKQKNMICRVGLALFLFLCLGSSQTIAQTVAMPDVVRLNSIGDKVGQPSVVAVDRNGRLYVTHPGADSVEVLSQSGKHIHTIEGLAEPVSVAVAYDGTIYIGSKGSGSVAIYGPDFQYQKKLSTGDGEFADPHDIAFDPAGNIHVVDKGNHVVKKYSSNGTYMTTMGSPGNDEGEFNYPLSIAVDAAAQEIIVLDCMEVQNKFIYTDMINGARIQFFSLNTGVFKRAYNLFGTVLASDDLMRPIHLEVDSQSRLYVTDSSFEEVKVYDNMCNFLGMLDDDAAPLSTPLGMALGSTNRLYVVSRNADRLDVFGLDDFTHLLVDPLAAKFTVDYGVLSAAAQSITIANEGTTDLAWTAECSDQWITLSATGGFLPPTHASTLEVGVQPAELDIGTYQGTVTIMAGSVVKEVVDVELRIVPNYKLSVTPNSLDYESDIGVTPLPQTLMIENLGTGLLQWKADVDREWISLSGTAGTAPSEVTVLADVSSLPVGVYGGNIVVTVQGESNAGPVTIPVNLTLNEPPPVEPPPEPPPEPPFGGKKWPGNAKMKWEAVFQLEGTSLNGIWGSSEYDIFVVGDSGTILHYNQGGWNPMESGAIEELYDVWGSSDSDVYAVGENGLILYYNGTTWYRINPGISGTLIGALRSVWRNAETEVYTVGNNGSILGSPSPSPWEIMFYSRNIATLRGVWGSSDTNIFAVGDKGSILHYDGTAWAFMNSGITETLYGIWGSSGSDIYAVGANGTILHFDGTTWSSDTSGTTAKLIGIWGNSTDEVYAVGENGTMLRYDGSQWKMVETVTEEQLNDVWSGKSYDIYAVSAQGSIIHGYARGFPWRILQPALEYNAKGLN